MCSPKKAKIVSQIGFTDVMPNLDMFSAANVKIGASTSSDMAKQSQGLKQLSIKEQLKGRTDVPTSNNLTLGTTPGLY